MTGTIDVLFSDQFIVPSNITEIESGKKLELEVLPFEEQSKEDVQFEWSVKTFEEKKMTIQLIFDKPYEISKENIFIITIKDIELFIR